MTGRRMYKDKENGMILGVCAGIAEFFDVHTWAVRLITVLLAVVVAFWPIALIYVMAAMLLRDAPLRYRGRRGERHFWRSGNEEMY